MCDYQSSKVSWRGVRAEELGSLMKRLRRKCAVRIEAMEIAEFCNRGRVEPIGQRSFLRSVGV